MDRIHVDIPDGNTDKLATASKAWLDFMYAKAVDQAGRDITNVLGALEQDNPALEPGLTDQLTTLSGAAYKIWAAAQQLSNDCLDHKDPLDNLRVRIKDAINQLEIATGIGLAVTVFADVITAGIGLLVLDAVTVAAEAKLFDQAAETITEAVQSVDVDQTLTAAAQQADALTNTSRSIDEVASLTPEEIEAEASGAEGANTTKASHQPNSSLEPTGPRAKIRDNDDDETRRSLQRENDSADILAKNGYETEQSHQTIGSDGVDPNKNPDYRIEGKIFDNYAPSSSNARNIASNMQEKVDGEQTQRIVLNLQDSNVTMDTMRKQLNDWPISGLKEVIAIDQSGNVVPLYSVP